MAKEKVRYYTHSVNPTSFSLKKEYGRYFNDLVMQELTKHTRLYNSIANKKNSNANMKLHFIATLESVFRCTDATFRCVNSYCERRKGRDWTGC